MEQEVAIATVEAFVERLNRSLRTRNFTPFLNLFVDRPTLARARKGVQLVGREAVRDFYRKSPPDFALSLKSLTLVGERWAADCEVSWRQLAKPLRERLWFTFHGAKIAALEMESRREGGEASGAPRA